MAPHDWRGWWRRHRRLIISVALLCLFFFLLGRYAQKTVSPLMCKIYG